MGQGSHPCAGGCGRPISANKGKCLACAAAQARFEKLMTEVLGVDVDKNYTWPVEVSK